MLGFALAGLLVAAGAQWQATHAPEQSRLRAALVGDVEVATADNEALASRASRLDEENRVLRERTATDDAEKAKLTGQIATLAPVVGQAGVHGPGVTIRIADPPTPQLPEGSRVVDHDLAEVVNVLWAAGAEAVTVGGVRLTALTAIRSAGKTILVGFRPLTSPYVIEAVGSPYQLAKALASSLVMARLRAGRAGAGGDVAVSVTRELTLPPAPGATPKRAGGLSP
jgi:uncharacterized protein YlxW (UPF0749 family)